MGIINKKVLITGLLLSTALVAPQKANAATTITATGTDGSVTVGVGGSGADPTDINTADNILLIGDAGPEVNTYTITTDAAFTLGGDITSATTTLANDTVIIDADSGALTLSGTNDFAAAVELTKGTLILGHTNALGDAANTLGMADDTELGILDGITINNAISLSTGATEAFTFFVDGASNAAELSGVISGGNATGTTLTINDAADAGTLTLNGANTFEAGGGISLAGGALILGNDDALGDAANILSLSNGTSLLLDENGNGGADTGLTIGNTVTLADAGENDAWNIGAMTGETSIIAKVSGGSADYTLNIGATDYLGAVQINDTTGLGSKINIVGSSELIIAGGQDLTAANTITSTDTAYAPADNAGVLTFAGTSNIASTIGTSAILDLAIINAGADNKTVTFSANVFANDLHFSNAADSGTIAFDSGADFTGNISTQTDGLGNLSFTGTGDSAVSGLVGTDTHRLKAISVSNTGTTTFSGGDVYANAVTVGDGSTATFADDVTTASIVAAGSGAATLNGATLNAAVNAIELISVTGNLTVNSVITDAAAAAQTKVTANSETGMVVLNGNNAFEGGLKVQTGTVILGHTNAAGLSAAADSIELVSVSKVYTDKTAGDDITIANNITAGNGSTIGTADATTTFSGDIKGTGTLNVGAAGYAGQVNLTGDNSAFTGKLAVADSTALNINGENAAGGAGSSFDVTYDSKLSFGSAYFGAADDVALDKVINVSGGSAWVANQEAIISAATGKTLNLTGDITALGAGATTSMLQIGDDAAGFDGDVVLDLSEMTETDITVGSLIVSSNGQLIGTGTVNGSVTVAVDGVQGPGNSVGTQTITGDYNLNGTLNAEVESAASYDQVVVTGTATIDQNADINITDTSIGGSSGRVATGSYNIIQAGTLVADDFITQANLNPDYNGSVAYTYSLGGTTNNYLVLTTALGGDVYNSVTDPNAKEMFDLLSDGSETLSTGLSNLVGTLQGLTSGSQLQEALNDLLPDTGAQVGGMMAGISNITGVINSRMAGNQSGFFGVPSGDDPYSYKTVGLWGQGIYSTASQDKRDGFDGYDADYYGGAAGFDFKTSDLNTLGLAYGYIKSDVDGSDGSKGDANEIETHQVSLYDAYKVNGWGFNSQLGYAWSKFETTRDLTSIGAGKAKGSFDGSIYSLDMNVTKDLISQYGFGIVPMVGAKYAYIDLDGYEETGSVAALKVKSRDYHSAKSVVGTKVLLGTASLDWFDNTTFTPSLYGYWSHEFINDSYDVKSTFTGGTTAFKTKGLKPAQDTYNAGVNFDFISSDIFTLSFTYDAEIKEDYLGHTGMVKARFDF